MQTYLQRIYTQKLLW